MADAVRRASGGAADTRAPTRTRGILHREPRVPPITPPRPSPMGGGGCSAGIRIMALAVACVGWGLPHRRTTAPGAVYGGFWA